MGRCLSQDCNEKDKITIGIDSLEALIVHSKQRKLPFELGFGGMAEWTIAAVLKTAGLTAPGVRIPLPP